MMRTIGKTVGKVGLVVAATIGIAWVIVSTGEDGEVQESRAMVWDFDQFEQSDTKKFARSLEQLGHEPPRVYDYNGNTVYFSTRTTKESPSKLVDEYQREFVAQGLNDEKHGPPNFPKSLSKEKAKSRFKDRMMARLNGEMVTQMSSPTRATMIGGGTTAELDSKEDYEQYRHDKAFENIDQELADLERIVNECNLRGIQQRYGFSSRENERKFNEAMKTCSKVDASTKEKAKARARIYNQLLKRSEKLKKCEAFQTYIEEKLQDFHHAEFGTEFFDSFRSVEMFRRSEGGATSVTAAWSPRGFDMSKVANGPDGEKERKGEVERVVPECPSCDHRFRFSAGPNGQIYTTNTFVSDQSKSRVGQYYTRKMREKGWKRTDSDVLLSEIMDRLPKEETPKGSQLAFRRGDQHITLRLYENDKDSTVVTALRTP